MKVLCNVIVGHSSADGRTTESDMFRRCWPGHPLVQDVYRMVLRGKGKAPQRKNSAVVDRLRRIFYLDRSRAILLHSDPSEVDLHRNACFFLNFHSLPLRRLGMCSPPPLSSTGSKSNSTLAPYVPSTSYLHHSLDSK